MRIALVAPDDWTIWLFYRDLVRALTEAGAHITVLSSAGPYLNRLSELGVEHVAVPYARFVSPLGDLRLLSHLRATFRRLRPDLVQNFTIKANLYGAVAAADAGVPAIINTVEGAGLLYSDTRSWRIAAIRAVVEVGLRRVRERVSRYWFVNAHDREVFVKRQLALPEKSLVAIATGVDTRLFNPEGLSSQEPSGFRKELDIPDEMPIVTFVAGRLLRSKGIGDFLEMAHGLQRSGEACQCVLVGPAEPDNPDAFPQAALADAVQQGVVRWVPFREDVWTVHAASAVIVVPTRYAEGTPKGVMEGMAMGRSVVCSSVPSIREMVSPDRDAVLVRPGDVGQLVAAVTDLLRSPQRRAALGREARRTAVTRFDSRHVARAALVTVYAPVLGWPQHTETVA